MHEKLVYRLKYMLGNNGELKFDRYFAELGLGVNDILMLRHIYVNILWLGKENNISETDFILGGK